MSDGIWNTDDAPTLDVLAMIRLCALTWTPDARLLGNVRAKDIARACEDAIQRIDRYENAQVHVADQPQAKEWTGPVLGSLSKTPCQYCGKYGTECGCYGYLV